MLSLHPSPLALFFLSLSLSLPFPLLVNHGLQLNVSLQNDPAFPSTTPSPFPPNIDPPIPVDVDVLRSIDDDDGNGKHYLVGNITFLCETNHSQGDMYFKYTFSDGDSEPYTNADSMTHVYESAGIYNYTVDAVAIDEKGSKAFHAVHSGQINVLGTYSVFSIYIVVMYNFRIRTGTPTYWTTVFNVWVYSFVYFLNLSKTLGNVSSERYSGELD